MTSPCRPGRRRSPAGRQASSECTTAIPSAASVHQPSAPAYSAVWWSIAVPPITTGRRCSRSAVRSRTFRSSRAKPRTPSSGRHDSPSTSGSCATTAPPRPALDRRRRPGRPRVRPRASSSAPRSSCRCRGCRRLHRRDDHPARVLPVSRVAREARDAAGSVGLAEHLAGHDERRRCSRSPSWYRWPTRSIPARHSATRTRGSSPRPGARGSAPAPPRWSMRTMRSIEAAPAGRGHSRGHAPSWRPHAHGGREARGGQTGRRTGPSSPGGLEVVEEMLDHPRRQARLVAKVGRLGLGQGGGMERETAVLEARLCRR